MLKIPDTRGKFFSVSRGVAIQGARFNPSICYPLTPLVLPAVERMASEGTAHIYTEKVRFVSGAALPVKKPETGAARSAPVPDAKAAGTEKPSGKKTSAALGKLGRRSGRDFD
jgi:hypothetical protein